MMEPKFRLRQFLPRTPTLLPLFFIKSLHISMTFDPTSWMNEWGHLFILVLVTIASLPTYMACITSLLRANHAFGWYLGSWIWLSFAKIQQHSYLGSLPQWAQPSNFIVNTQLIKTQRSLVHIYQKQDYTSGRTIVRKPTNQKISTLAPGNVSQVNKGLPLTWFSDKPGLRDHFCFVLTVWS